MTNKVDLLTPVGRMVQGHPMEQQTTDHKGNPLVTKTGPNIGKPRVAYFFAIAIPKNDPQWPAFKQQIDAIAQASYPAGEWQRPGFAWKIVDGDSTIPNENGGVPANMEGFPGNWVIRCSGGFEPKVYTAGGASQIVDKTQIKRGDYVRAYLSVKSNDQSGSQAGIYLNPNMVEFVGYGQEIVTGPSGEQVFGGAPAALPPGASATPLAPTTTIAQPQQQQTMAPPPVQQQQTMAPPPPVQQTVAPAPDFLNPDERKVNYNGTVYTVGFLKQNGWNEAQIATLPAA